MKVYNKKGLVWGIVWVLLGLSGVILAIVRPSDNGLLNVKHLVIDGFVLLVGIVMVTRAFSHAATCEDLTEESDERNVLIETKTGATTFSVLFWTLCVLFAVGVVGFYFTGLDIYVGLFVFAGLLGVFATVVGIIAKAYYERHL